METPPMVYKSNALIEAAYRLSLQEQRILLACISQVRRDEVVTDEVLYSVTAADLAQLSGTAIEAAYSELKTAALRLKRREVRLTEEPNGKGRKPKVMITSWVQTIIYCEGEGRVELRFTKDMLPYLTELTRQFTKYALADVAKMNSAHAIRLYELLMQWDSLGRREIELDQLRDWLQLESRYPSIKDFKKWVIEPAVAQINEHSPLQVSWSQRKTGRRVTHLVFDFGPKKPAKVSRKSLTKRNDSESNAELAALARPGESWEQLRDRLNRMSKVD
ncbi:replication initiation protein [Azomonas macrocytogenes]|uniref:Plasmid replication initiation protein n=1 Tax=Azomonas macrocytogenes TaxID=69962 RepID=A0A839TAH1_AZOMA|nr:replication initiation protein [Azomonas macrocytogenes]MBB3105456.1 plasmid replication initiation protein [Azomonas macrocytogenes]